MTRMLGNSDKTDGRGDTEVHAIRGIDLDLPRGRFTAIMGPSGSGKSTLMHCLAGLDGRWVILPRSAATPAPR